MQKRITMLPGVCAAATLTATGVAAQSLEEITVTARKTTESLQEVPLAITAVGEQEIQRLGIKDLNKLAQQDASVQFDEGFTPSDTRITIRGLSPTRGRPNAATLVDGIDVGSEAVSNPGGSVLVNPRLLDVARIEIVKGPQSALYGRSAFAGAIQYVTKDPADAFEANLSVDASNRDDREIRGNVSVPLNDELGMLVNGYAWDNRGYYRNSVTDEFVGGGQGLGSSITFKWEPTDSVDFKWRTEYTDDETQPPAQLGLNEFNTWVDLGDSGNLGSFVGQNTGPSNLAPNTSNCVTAPGNPGPGPLSNPGANCTDISVDGSKALTLYFLENENAPYTDTTPGFTPDLGIYDSAIVEHYNQYNRQVVNTFVGKVPDGKNLRATLNPNYTFGPGAINPTRARDYEGVDKEVFRTSLVANWAASDDLTLTSYTGFTEANVTTQQDLGRYFIDDCTVDPAALFGVPDPTGNFASYGDAIASQGVTSFERFAPCSIPLSDGVNDSRGAFTQDDINDTRQFNQEFRANWQIDESWNLTGGVLYWREDVEVVDRNITLIGGGPECYINDLIDAPNFQDSSQNPGTQFFTQTDAIHNQCGRTQIVAAYWLGDIWEARAANPTVQERATRHYSFYSSLEWQITDQWTARAETRFTREDNDITAPVMTPCLNGAPANDPDNPDSCFTGGAPNKLLAGGGGQPTGPSTIALCGQNGRCDRLGIAPISGSLYYPGSALAKSGTEFSWWEYGYSPMLSFQATPDTRKDRYWTPRFTVEYYPTDDVMSYFTWSRGIKPGGYSLLTIGAFGLDPNLDGSFDEAEFEPERLDVWEWGWKSTLWDGRFRFNGSLFYQDFKDKQISLQKVIGVTTGIVTENISGSEIRGLELDSTVQVTDNLVVQLGYTFLDSEYTDYTQVTNSATTIAKEALGPNPDACAETAVIPGSNPADPRYGCVVSYNGNEIERSPKHSVILNTTYTANLFDTGLEWYGKLGLRYQDSRWIEQYNIAELQEYVLADMQLGIVSDDWEVLMFIDNVFDDRTIRNAGPTVGIPNANFAFGLKQGPFIPERANILAGPILPQDLYANLAPPRTWGVRANLRFGE